MKAEDQKRLVEANVKIADSLSGIRDNLKVINDHNILHHEQTVATQNILLEKVKAMTEKYWYLLFIAMIIIGALAGVEKVAKLFV